MNRIRFLRTVGWLEGISYLLLLGIAMPLKYLFDQPLAVRYTGMIHGILFIVFVYALLNAALTHKWSLSRTALVFGASLIPLGPLLIEPLLKRAELES
jgi:integral membrane protein